jgi:hypothetical protein
MTRGEAKEILQAFRPNGKDAQDPFFSEALAMVAVDPVLADWFAAQQSFDSQMSRAVAQVPIPPSLEMRLARQPSRQYWWNRALRPIEYGLAATIALFLAIGGFWMHSRASAFDPLRANVLRQTWAGSRHVDLQTTNLAEIRRFIAANDLRGDFKLPPELAVMHAHGCKLLTVKKQKVPYICFMDGPKHLHLVVLDHKVCPQPPLMAMPEFASWEHWTTATWTQGDMTFILSGLNPVQFVKKFRREGQWNWGG